MRIRTKHYSIVLFGISLMTGIFCERYAPELTDTISPNYFIGMALFGLLGFWIAIKKEKYSFSHYLTALFFLVLGYVVSRVETFHFETNKIKLEKANKVSGQISEVRDYGDFKQILIKTHLTKHYQPKVLVNLFDVPINLSPGQYLKISLPPEEIRPPKNPYQFNSKKYWRRYKVSHQITVNHPSIITNQSIARTSFLLSVKEKIYRILDSQFENTGHSGMLKALLLGNKTGVTDRDKENFKTIGALHILAVSGLHVGIISFLIFWILSPLYLLVKSKNCIYILTALMIWIYAILTGMKIPIIRATLVVTLYLVAKILERKSSPCILLSWAAIAVLIWQPKDLFTVSFQLSFGAVASILTFQDPIYTRLSKYTGKNQLTRLTAVSIAAQIGTWPFLMWHFHQFSHLSLISSLVIIPLLFPLLLTAVLGLILFHISGTVSAVFFKISTFCMNAIQEISLILASLGRPEQFSCYRPEFILIIGSIIIISGISIYFRLNLYRFIPLLLILGLLLEILNIYEKRNQTVVSIYHDTRPVIDIYKNGFCYTNQTQPVKDYVGINRAKFKISKIILLFPPDVPLSGKNTSVLYNYEHNGKSFTVIDVQNVHSPLYSPINNPSKIILSGKSYLLKNTNDHYTDSIWTWDTYEKGFYRTKLK